MGFRPLRPVDAEFLTNAPRIILSTGVVAAPPDQVFDALAGDPSTWTWFPGFSDQGRWLSSPPHGAGSRREVHMVGGVRYRETILVWEKPLRWGFRIDEASAPIARALAEEYRLVADGDRTVVHWMLCADGPALNVALGLPLARPVMGRLWRRACANLESRLGTSHP